LAAGGRFHSALIVDGEFEEMDEAEILNGEDSLAPNMLARLSARNLPHVQVLSQIGLNVYSILQHRTLIITKSALSQLIERLDTPIKR
jgi:large subunit ribosomal protein L4